MPLHPDDEIHPMSDGEHNDDVIDEICNDFIQNPGDEPRPYLNWVRGSSVNKR